MTPTQTTREKLLALGWKPDAPTKSRWYRIWDGQGGRGSAA